MSSQDALMKTRWSLLWIRSKKCQVRFEWFKQECLLSRNLSESHLNRDLSLACFYCEWEELTFTVMMPCKEFGYGMFTAQTRFYQPKVRIIEWSHFAPKS